ncbi:MAG: biosynthetic arginine decarboxylase [Bdellovibrionota bacterium]|nr:biosynthetic arginine decarboxylase [Bdellovibrionota bacterium]
MSFWSVEQSLERYGTQYWGLDFFNINEKGNVIVTPNGDKSKSIDLKDLTEDLQDRGIRLPILVRFPNIVHSRIKLLSDCFQNAMSDCDYKADYMGVYPIKVNQHRDLVKEVVESGKGTKLGLEAGSKPELLVVLAMMENPNGLVICNGFKDEEYIETALLSRKIGRNTIIVVDRMDELPMILDVSEKLNIEAKIGLRVKLYSKGAGKWVDSSGARSKFGLTPSEVCKALDILKERDKMDSLELVHFHIGSQIPSIQSIKSSLKEGARYYAEIKQMGAKNLQYIDVGGGLGVDYDGTGKSNSSTNYSEQEYANDVVYAIAQVCDRHEVPHPNIVTEAGRALVAHHSVLLMNVLGVNEVAKKEHNVVPERKDSPIIHNLAAIYSSLNVDSLNEAYNDVMELKEDALKLYSLGYLSLTERAKAEDLVWTNLTRILELAYVDPSEFEEIINHLTDLLSDTYFTNFSIFQSIPDSWAVNHHFPVMPIHRLAEEPSRKAILVDLTCDSDGKIDSFVESGKISKSISVHELKEDENYYMGVFLIGAYQEALGDLHNLFGDTDSVDVCLHENGYKVSHVSEGDTVAEVLSYIHYHRNDLLASIRNAIEANITENKITGKEARLLVRKYEEGLSGYTYLE